MMDPQTAPEGLSLFTVASIVEQIEATYLFEYARFTGMFREYLVAALEEHFKREPNDIHRRAFVLGIYREEYTAYEDLGAFLDAFLGFVEDPTVRPMERLLRYGPGEVKLERVFSGRNITTGDHLMDRLGILGWVPDGWTKSYPEIDVQKVIRRGCFYFVTDCWTSQKPEGVSAFNKIKHGALLVPDGRLLAHKNPDGPAAIFITNLKSKVPEPTPVAVLTITMTDQGIEERLKQIQFVQRTLRLFVMLFLSKHCPTYLKEQGFNDPLDYLKSDPGIFQLIQDLSATPWQPS